MSMNRTKPLEEMAMQSRHAKEYLRYLTQDLSAGKGGLDDLARSIGRVVLESPCLDHVLDVLWPSSSVQISRALESGAFRRWLAQQDDPLVPPRHPGRDPRLVAARRTAFRDLQAPQTLQVGDLVWIQDHYYPGMVRSVTQTGTALVQTATWDYWTESTRSDADGRLVLDEYAYPRSAYQQLRVDPSSEKFFPSQRSL